MILVTGASGKTGKAVIRKMVEKGANVRAWVHTPMQEVGARQVGAVDVVSGDLRDPERMVQGCTDIKAVYHICPNMNPDEVEIGRNMIHAAKSTGVNHFVYHSVFHPQVQSMPHHWNKLLVEEQIFSSGIIYTILQPTAYLQNLLPYWQRIVTEGVYEVPYAVDTRLSMVDLEDVADAAAAVTNNPDYHGGSYELVATPPYTQIEIAQMIESRIQKPVKVIHESRSAWKEKARQNGMDEFAVRTLIKMFEYYEQYGMWGNSHTLKSILNRSPVGLSEFIDRLIQTQTLKTEENNG